MMSLGEWFNIVGVAVSTFGAILTATWWLASKMERTHLSIERLNRDTEKNFAHLEQRITRLEERIFGPTKR